MKVVGISEMLVCDDASEVLVTYSLGSCLGVSFYDTGLKIGGLIHCMLPLSKIDPVKATQSPGMFVDTGIPLILQKLFDLGVSRKNLIIKVAGGASLLDDSNLFKIGERNHAMLRKILWKNNLLIKAEDVGKDCPRTMFLHIDNGLTEIRSKGVITQL